jgi:putative transposase
MPELTELPDPARQRALERFRILRPHFEQNVPLAQVARAAGLPDRTARRWVALYRRLGLPGLARRSRADTGKRHSLSLALLRLAEGLALQKPPLPVAAIYREVCRVARVQEEPAPGYHSVYRAIKALPAALTTLAHHGEKAYRETYDLVHRREAERPNQLWQADHTQLDLWAKRAGGKIGRPWVTIVIDDYSRAIAGFFVSFDSPSAVQTALALRQAIWRKAEPRWIVFGVPEILYTDNGSDFTSTHLEQVSADLKMRLIFSTPGHPRGRGRIERFFETVNQMFLCTLPGYIDGGTMRGEPTLTLTELDRHFRDFLHDYHVRLHGETKVAPQERWQHGGFIPRVPESLEQLDLLLLTVAQTRKVRPDGVRFQGMRYIDPTLAAYVGESMVLRYDPRDMAEVRLFHQGKFVCRAICPELAGQTVALRDIRQARDQRRRDLRQALRERRNTVESLLDLRRGVSSDIADHAVVAGDTADATPHTPTLKRYQND